MGQQNILVILGNEPSAFGDRSKVGGLKERKWTVLRKWTACLKIDGQQPKSGLYDRPLPSILTIQFELH